MVEFLQLLNRTSNFINITLSLRAKTILAKEEKNPMSNVWSLLLVLLNYNNAKFLDLYITPRLKNFMNNRIPGFHTKEENNLFNAQENVSNLFSYFLNQKRNGLQSPYESVFMIDFIKWFLEKENFSFMLKLRKLLNDTKDIKATTLELKTNLNENLQTQASNKAFDLLMGTTWLNSAEPLIIDSQMTEESKYKYVQKYNKPVRLIYNFFKTRILSPVFWPTIFSFIKHQRILKINIQSNFINFDRYWKLNKKEQTDFFSENLVVRKYPYISTSEFNDTEWPTTPSFLTFHTLVLKLPLLFSFFSQLNYILFLLFGELFGSVFNKMSLFYSNFHLIRLNISQWNVNWKVEWLIKIFLFLLLDLWKYIFKGIIIGFFFLKNVVFGGNLVGFTIVWWFQFVLFCLQKLRVNQVNFLYHTLYTIHYKEFFQYKLGKNPTLSNLIITKFGILGYFVEKLVFVVIFVIFGMLDIGFIVYICLLKQKVFFFLFNAIKIFLRMGFLNFCIYIFSPISEFFFFCIYLAKSQEKNFSLTSGEKILTGVFLFRFYLKKFWWDVEIPHQKGLKKIPFFFKYANNFIWFQRFLLVWEDCVYIFKYIKNKIVTSISSFCVNRTFNILKNTIFSLKLSICFLFFYVFILIVKVSLDYTTKFLINHRSLNDKILDSITKIDFYQKIKKKVNYKTISFYVFPNNMDFLFKKGPESFIDNRSKEKKHSAEELLMQLYYNSNINVKKKSLRNYKTVLNFLSKKGLNWSYKKSIWRQSIWQKFVVKLFQKEDFDKSVNEVTLLSKLYFDNKQNSWLISSRIDAFFRYTILKEYSKKLNVEITEKKNSNLDLIWFRQFLGFFKQRIRKNMLVVPGILNYFYRSQFKIINDNVQTVVDAFENVHLNGKKDSYTIPRVLMYFGFLKRKKFNILNSQFIDPSEQNYKNSLLSDLLIYLNFSLVFCDFKIPELIERDFYKNHINLKNKKFLNLFLKIKNFFYYECIMYRYFTDYCVILWVDSLRNSKGFFNRFFLYNDNSVKTIFFKKLDLNQSQNINVKYSSDRLFNVILYLQSILPFFFEFFFQIYYFILLKKSYLKFDVYRFLSDEVYWTAMTNIRKIMLFGFFNQENNTESVAISHFSYEKTFFDSVSEHFMSDFQIYDTRYKVYIFYNLKRDLTKLVKVINLSLQKSSRNHTESELSNDDQFFSDYLESDLNKKSKLPVGIKIFEVSQNLPRRVKDMLLHNNYWFTSFFKVENVNMSSTTFPYRKDNKFKDKKMKNDSNLFYTELNYIYWMYHWLTFKYDILLWLFYLRCGLYFSYTTRYIWLFLVLWVSVFGLLGIFSIKYWIILGSIVYSWLSFSLGVLGSLFMSTVFFGEIFNVNVLREMYEFIFYNYVLTMPFYDILVKFELYEVFVFMLQNLSLHEEAGFNLLRFMWIVHISFFISGCVMYFEWINSLFLMWSFFFSFIESIDFLQNNSLLFSIKIMVFSVPIEQWFLYDFLLSINWYFVFLLEYGYDFILLNYMYVHIIMEGFLTQVLMTLSYEFLYAILYNYFEVVFSKYLYFQYYIIGVFLAICSNDIFFTISLDKIFIFLFFDLLRYYFWLLIMFFGKCFWTFVYIIVSLVDFSLDGFIWAKNWVFTINHLFFKEFIFADLIVYIIQIFCWLYFNIIYYILLKPFIILLYVLFSIIKFVVFLPQNIVSILYTICSFVYNVLLFCGSVLMFLCINILEIYATVGRFLTIDVLVHFLFEYLISLFHIIDAFIEGSPWLAKLSEGAWFISKVILIVLTSPLLAFFLIFKKMILWLFLPLIWIGDLLQDWVVFVIEFMPYIVLLFKEVLLLIGSIFLQIIKVFSFIWYGLINIILVFIELIDEIFPTLKHIFDPFGGISIFYATIYYYIFILICILWSYSYRIFNDTLIEPPVPESAWAQNVEVFETHPVFQRLPLDVYRLLFSERLCSDEIKMPLELKESLEIWTPVEESLTFSPIRIKETPLQLQGYYYMLLNDMAKKYIIQYYKKKHIISWFLKLNISKIFERKSWDRIGYARTLNGLWETYAEFYEKTVTEEDMEHLETSFEIIKIESKIEKITSLGEFLVQFEFWFRDEMRKHRAKQLHLEQQELFDHFAYGQSDEVVWSFPIVGKWFGNQRHKDIENTYKTVVFSAGIKQGIDFTNNESEKLAKKNFILNWMVYNKLFEERAYHLQHSLNGFTFNEIEGTRDFMKNKKGKVFEDEEPELDPDMFIIKRYKKVYFNDNDDVDADFALDPFFFSVRFLDLLLYPIIVFATVNTGWWYTSNGMMDAIMRYTSLEQYSARIAESFLKEMENSDIIKHNQERSDFDVFTVQLYEPTSYIAKYMPEDSILWNSFVDEYPELYNNALWNKDPAAFFNAFYTFLKTNELGQLWVEELVERPESEDFYYLMTPEDSNIHVENEDYTEKSYNSLDQSTVSFLEKIYTPGVINDAMELLEEMGPEHPNYLPSQLFNKWEEIPENKAKSSLNIFSIIKEMISNKSLENELSLKKDDNLVFMRDEEIHEKEEESWFGALHPIESEFLQRKLILRYHVFPKTNLLPNIWFKEYSNLKQEIKSDFTFIDNNSAIDSFILHSRDKWFERVDFDTHLINEETFFLSEQLSSLDVNNIPILRQTNLPWNDSLWKEVYDLESSLRSLDDLRNSIDMWQDFWLKYLRNHKVIEISTIADDIQDEILFGDIVYQYHTTGFLSLFQRTTVHRFFWLFYKIYEDTFLGKLWFQFLRHGVMRRYSTGIEVAPNILKTIDSSVGLIGLNPFFVISDVKYLKSDFFNSYTNYSAYLHFGPMLLQRLSLVYFAQPSLFDNNWFKTMMESNFHVALETLIDHVKHASYIYPTMYSMQEIGDNYYHIHSMLLQRWVDLKKIIVLFNNQISKALYDIAQYGLSYRVISSLYTSVAEPLMGLYEITRNILKNIQFVSEKIQNIIKYIVIDLHFFNRIWALGVYLMSPIVSFVDFTKLWFHEIGKDIFFFLNSESLAFLGLTKWWQFSIIRGVFVFWKGFINSILLCFENNEINPFWFYIITWPWKWIEWKDREDFAFLVINTSLDYVQDYINQYGYFFLLASYDWFSVSSFVYSFKPDLIYYIFWISAPFTVPLFWVNLLFAIDKWIHSSWDLYYTQFKYFRALHNNEYIFLLEWEPNTKNTLDTILYHDIITYFIKTDPFQQKWISSRNVLSKNDFNKNINDLYFLEAQTLKPLLSRENNQAPFSFMDKEGVVVYSPEEIDYLSYKYTTQDFNVNLYSAIDFLQNYNPSFYNKSEEEMIYLWQIYKNISLKISNDNDTTTLHSRLLPHFSFLTEIGPDFYLNLKRYEDVFSVSKVRFFFFKYQELVGHVFSCGNVLEKQTTDTVLDRKYLYDRSLPSKISFESLKTTDSLPLTKGIWIEISQDIYGNVMFVEVNSAKKS